MARIVGASIDVETTGLISGVHEIVEMSIILHNEKFMPMERFTTAIKPMHPERADMDALLANGLSLVELKTAPTPPQIRNAFFQWHQDVAQGRRIIPLGHNFSFDKSFLKLFFGDYYDEYFYYKNRDTFTAAQLLKDCGLLDPGQSLSLGKLCEEFKIPHVAHTSHGDAIATLILYRKLMALTRKA